jgi:hypothetical protein
MHYRCNMATASIRNFTMLRSLPDTIEVCACLTCRTLRGHRVRAVEQRRKLKKTNSHSSEGTLAMAKKECIPEHLKPWIEARKRFRLSHMHIQMARELGMHPKKLGKLANHRQEPWKAPLPIFIEDIYFKRFGKYKPDEVRTIK